MTSHLHDAAEDVDEDATHVRISGQDLERRGHLRLRRPAAHVEEVAGDAPKCLMMSWWHAGGAIDHDPMLRPA